MHSQLPLLPPTAHRRRLEARPLQQSCSRQLSGWKHTLRHSSAPTGTATCPLPRNGIYGELAAAHFAPQLLSAMFCMAHRGAEQHGAPLRSVLTTYSCCTRVCDQGEPYQPQRLARRGSGARICRPASHPSHHHRCAVHPRLCAVGGAGADCQAGKPGVGALAWLLEGCAHSASPQVCVRWQWCAWQSRRPSQSRRAL